MLNRVYWSVAHQQCGNFFLLLFVCGDKWKKNANFCFCKLEQNSCTDDKKGERMKLCTCACIKLSCVQKFYEFKIHQYMCVCRCSCVWRIAIVSLIFHSISFTCSPHFYSSSSSYNFINKYLAYEQSAL